MSSEKREKFNSRIGFILVATGCAVGLGNVWKFPYLCGQNGGAAFIVCYLACLLLLGLPILTCELAVGRASRQSSVQAFSALEPKGTQWHKASWMGIAGSYLLMMFYTAVCGWMVYYFIKYASGSFSSSSAIAGQFSTMLASPSLMTASTFAVIAAAFGICSLGVQKGIEKVTKVMMTSLFILLIILAIHSILLPGAEKGLAFYLIPDFDAMISQGAGNVIFAAMSQAFFTLSIGIGAMAIFGSYLGKDRTLAGESLIITGLDTLVALFSGLIIIPACFSYNIDPDAGPSLIFITMPHVFSQMPGGQIWGTLFFLFLVFAALSTVVAVFENIIANVMGLLGWSRRKAIAVNLISLTLLSLPCILGFNVLSDFEPLGKGSTILDLEDFLVSNNFLPLGALVYLAFCVSRNGWGWNAFIKEANTGVGPRFPRVLRPILATILPLSIVIIYLKGYYDKFSPDGPVYLGIWMTIACLFLAFLAYILIAHKKDCSNSEETASNAQPLTESKNH